MPNYERPDFDGAIKKPRYLPVKLCVVCGKPREGRTRIASQKTCSAACGYALRKSSNHASRVCTACGKTYTSTARDRVKYCSRRCYIKAIGVRPAMVEVNCAHCGKVFRRTAAAIKRVRRSFCGRECAKVFLRGDKHYAYRGDKDPNRGAKWNRLADQIRARDCYSCRRCGMCQNGNGQNGEKLSVDHVRPWRSLDDKEEANHPSNLVALCRRCHSYKTSAVEAAWLRGDVLAWRQWVKSLHLESAAVGTRVLPSHLRIVTEARR